MSKGKQHEVRAHCLANFREVVGDRHVITATAGPPLEPIILSLGGTPDYRREDDGGPSFPKQRSSKPNDFRIHYQVEGDWRYIDLAPTVENYHAVQPLGDDEWLLIRGRSESGKDRNAHVYDRGGRLRRSFPAGDGIQEVQTTRDSKIWISFFDEGVFSNVELGQTGLICVDKRGVKLHDFAPIAAKTGPIDDCYALNVADDHDTWVYYYTDFPLVKLTEGTLANFWRGVPVKGARAFAVAEGRILFAGSYKDPWSLFDFRLGSRAQKLIPVDENGARIGRFDAFGRSNGLFLTTEESLFLIDASCL